MDQMPAPVPNAPLSGAASHIDKVGLVIIVWVCFSAATLFVTFRLTVRWRQNRYFLPDDYWIIFAWLCALTMAILQTIQMEALWFITYLTAGRISSADPTMAHNLTELTRWQFPVIKLFWTILWSVKASFLAAFYRLVKPIRWARNMWYGVAVFAFLAYVGCWISSTLTCTPVGDYFIPGKCESPVEKWRQTFNVIYSTTVDVTTDLLIMAIPLTLLPTLQLDRKRKIGLGIAFSLGAIIVIVAIVRMTQVIVREQVDLIGLAIWGAVETGTAIIVGSLLPLKALLSRRVKHYQSSKKTSQRYGGSSGSAIREGLGGSPSKNVWAESIPLDHTHRIRQENGGIYVERTYEIRVGDSNSSREWINRSPHIPGTGQNRI